MEENRNQDLNNNKDIYDDQERLHFQFSSILGKKTLDSQKTLMQLRELRILQTILNLLIFSGITALIILSFIGVFFLIIIVDVGVVISFLSYLGYLRHKYRKILKVSRKELKYFIRMKKRKDGLSTLLIIFYSIIIILTISILFLSIIGIDPYVLFIIIGVSLVFIYFNEDIKDDKITDF